MRTRSGLALALLVAALPGCAVGPHYKQPDIPVPHAFVAAPAASAQPDSGAESSAKTASRPRPGDVDLTQWWRSLHDPELDSLVERAIRANPDVEIALTHLQQARVQEAGELGSALPTVVGSAVGGKGTGSDLSRMGAAAPLRAGDSKGSEPIKQVAGFAATWELDLFGGYRRAIEAGRADIAAAAAERSNVLISVISDVTRNYIDMRGVQARRAILRDNISAATQSRDFEQQRYDHGLTNELDLQLAKRELGTLEAQLPMLQAQLNGTQYNLATLLGAYPEDLAAELAAPDALPMLPQQLNTGLPVDLLRRRPDIRAAERKLAADTARIGVAAANLFPQVTLTGGLGTQSSTLGTHGSHIYSFGPSVYWPLLDFGVLDAQVENADLQAHGQLVAYKKTILTAVRDADTAIANYSAQQRRLVSLREAMDASERAVSLAQQRYDRGLTDFLNVVDAEHQQFTLEDEYTAARQSAGDAFVKVCQSLGGGWESFQNIPNVRRPKPAIIASVRELVGASDEGK